MLELPTVALRGLALGLLLAFALGTQGLVGRPGWALRALLACLAGYLLRSAPQAADWPTPLLLALSVPAVLFPAALWWLVRTAFDDRADVPKLFWAAVAALLAIVLLPPSAAPSIREAVGAGQKLAGLALVGAALWRLWNGRADDLVLGRRVLRGVLLGYAAVHGLAVLAVELGMAGRRPPAWLDFANMGFVALALSLSLALLLRMQQRAVDALFGIVPRLDVAQARVISEEPAVPEAAASLARLEELMKDERIYRSPELALAELAKRCGLPEYRLRELIHRGLGFRNFPAYVNEYRLREVECRLSNPADDRLPILTLALEAGFGSIGPFNRLFRERHGVTPSAYRQARRGAAPSGNGEDCAPLDRLSGSRE